MERFLFQLGSTSALMGLLALLYRLILLWRGNRRSAAWRFGIWVVILFGFLLVYKPRFSAPAAVISVPGAGAAVVSPSQIGGHWAPPALTALWVCGFLITLLWHFGRNDQFVSYCRRYNSELDEEPLRRALAVEQKRLGLNRQIDVSYVGGLSSPLLQGVLHPAIYLPELSYSRQELSYILSHELIHYRRKDLIWKYLLILVQALHWFNPVVYWMGEWTDQSCEAACDAAVLRARPQKDRSLYCATILKFLRQQKGIRSPLTTGFSITGKSYQRRFREILNGRRLPAMRLACLVMVLAVAVSGSVFALAPQTPLWGEGDGLETSMPDTSNSQFDYSGYSTVSAFDLTDPSFTGTGEGWGVFNPTEYTE